MPASNKCIGNHDLLTYSSVFDLTNVVFVCGWAKTASGGDYSFQDMLKRGHPSCAPKILNVGDKLPNKKLLKPLLKISLS